MEKSATRNDVAKLAGVSPAVVSYVLNNSNYVSAEKREAVLKAVKELGYYPNVLARGLKTSKSSQIAFICDNIDNEWLAEMESLLFQKGFYVSLCYSRQSEEFLQMLIRRQYEGIFMMTNIFSTEQLNHIAANDVPMILYKTKSYGKLDDKIVTVVPDYSDGVQKAVDYLALKGHKYIGLIPPLKYKTKGISGDDFRVKAYVESLRRNNLPVEESLVCLDTQTVDDIFNSVFRMVAGTGNQMRPTALVVGNDYLAAQIMQFLKKLGLSIPGDVAVIGTDNTNIAHITSPPLTSVDFSKKLFAQTAVDTLIGLIEGKTPEHAFIGVRLVIREST